MVDTYWDFWVGGILIAACCLFLPWMTGKFLGVTKGYASLCSLVSSKKYFQKPEFGGAFGPRSLFIFGLAFGGFLASLQHGGYQPRFDYGMFDLVYSSSLFVKIPILLLGGALWGFGARLANGCTSGNSISGLARGSLAALITTIGFLVAGILLTYTINFLRGML